MTNESLFPETPFNPGVDRLLGIDWGIHGGFVWNDESGVHAVPMPLRGAVVDYPKVFELLVNEIKPSVAYAEAVNPLPNQSSVATASFYRHIGTVEGILLSCACSAVLVTPMEWQAYFTDKRKSDFKKQISRGERIGKLVKDNTAWKKHLQEIAIKLYNSPLLSLNTSDAYLIWRFAQENHATRRPKLRPPKFTRKSRLAVRYVQTESALS